MQSTEPDALEPCPDKLLPSALAKQVLEMLKASEEASYKVWLLLSNKFGAGQKL